MPKVVDPDQLRSQIRQAAREVFSHKGLSGTGLAHVARKAKVSRATLYHYYEDKDALIRDLANELLAEEARMFERALHGDGTVADRIELLSQAIVARFLEWSNQGGALLEVWIGQKEIVGSNIRQLRKSLSLLLKEGQQSGEIEPSLNADATATIIIGLIDGLIIQVFLDRPGIPSDAIMRAGLSRSLRQILQATSR